MMTRVAYAIPGREATTPMIRRVVRQVTSKRQVTIPKEFFEAAGIGALVEIVLDETTKTITMRAVNPDDWGVAERIIEDLAAEGVSAQDMPAAFTKRKAEIEAAIRRACDRVDRQLRENSHAGRDFLAARLKELEQNG